MTPVLRPRFVNGVCLLLIIISGIAVWSTNRKAHFAADDYLYSFQFNPGFVDQAPTALEYQRITGIHDYIHSLSELYHTLTGRIVAHGLLQIMLLLPAWVFDILNTIVLFTLTWFFATWVAGKRHENRLAAWTLISMLFYLAVGKRVTNFYLPAFACNYVWTQLLVFVFLAPVRRLIQEDGQLSQDNYYALLTLFLGILAGDTNEPVVPAILLAMGVWGLWSMVVSHKRIPAFYFTGFAGLLLGFVFLYFAPGNSGRAMYESGAAGTRSIGLSLANAKPILRSCLASIPAVILGIIGMIRLIASKFKRLDGSSVFVFILGAGTVFALLFTPFYIPRMNILFVGFLVVWCLSEYLKGETEGWGRFVYVIILLLPFFGACLWADYSSMEKADKEQQLFLGELKNCPGDSCLVEPRAYLDPITRPNWAKPIATYYGKRVIWVKDDYAPQNLAAWKKATYRSMTDQGEDAVRLLGLQYLNHSPYSRTLYVVVDSAEPSIKPDSLKIVFQAADVPEWSERFVFMLSYKFLSYVIPMVPIFRPQHAHDMGKSVVYALSMPRKSIEEDIIRLGIEYRGREIKAFYLRDVDFGGN